MATATRKRARRSSGEHANDPVTSVAGAAAPRPGGEAALVPRTPLVRRLLAARGAPLAMVVAPAGYGKSVLLTQWAERDERRFAWMRAAEEHNDPVRLIGALAETLCQAGVFTEDLATAIADARDVAPARMLLRNAVASATCAFVLVLDDAQLLQAPPAVDILAMLIDRLGAGSQLALASRIEPGLPVGRLRANRKLVELRASDLVMTRREAGWLATLTGLELDSAGLDLLVRRTEGWPAGLYLAALAAREQPGPAEALAAFTGEDRAVADYIREELLDSMSQADIEFLCRASVLERVSGPLCDFVLEREGSARLLRTLSRLNVLLVPLDRTDTEYRHHRLLGQMLRAELRYAEPAREQTLHRRASEWYAVHGDVEHAIEQAVSTGDTEFAGTLLWKNSAKSLGYGNNPRLRAWLDRFSGAQIASQPTLALTAAASHLMAGDRDAAERLSSVAEHRVAALPSSEHGSLNAGIAVLRAAVARDGVVAMAELAADAYAGEAEDSPWRALACLIQGVSLQLRGEPETERLWLEEGARRGAVGAPAFQVLCLAQLALRAIDRDDWEAAELLAARAKGQVERTELREYPTSALVYAVSADVQARVGRVDVSREDARDAHRLLASLTEFTPWYQAECAITLARAGLRLGDVAGAQRLLDDAARHLELIPEATVAHSWHEECRTQAELSTKSNASGGWSLTTAELRVLQFLPTHLSFPEIAERLYVSANTVKTHTRAVYRKLDASSRGEAVVRAQEAGLLDAVANGSGQI